MITLQNKTALVTGASRGIGRATALALAEAGAHVLIHYGRSVQQAESLAAEIQAKGRRADVISADLGTPNGAALLASELVTGHASMNPVFSPDIPGLLVLAPLLEFGRIGRSFFFDYSRHFRCQDLPSADEDTLAHPIELDVFD